jgi:hypothetical protein
MRDDLHQGSRSEPRMPVLTAAHQRNRHTRSENDACRQRIGERGELPRDDIALLKVRGEEDVRLARYGRADTLYSADLSETA